jgi:hypothetical protein
MKLFSLHAICPAALLASVLLFPVSAHAQLLFTLSNPNQAGVRGQTLTFNGSLTNTGASTAFLNGDSFTLSGTGFTLDDSPFFDGAPLFLTAGQVYAGPLFEVAIALNAPIPQIGKGTFTIVGGPTDLSQNNLATQNFSVVIGAPEPATVGLCLIGATALLPLARRRRLNAQHINTPQVNGI